MKSGVAAFAAAAVDYVRQTPPDGAIILAITGDEEGEALEGTTALLDHMDRTNEQMSVCLVGEPTCPDEMGDMVGSLSERVIEIQILGDRHVGQIKSVFCPNNCVVEALYYLLNGGYHCQTCRPFFYIVIFCIIYTHNKKCDL